MVCRNCVELIIYNTSRLNFSESTLWREIILIIKKEKPIDFQTKVCRLKEFPNSIQETTEIVDLIKNGQESVKFELNRISQKKLESMKDWSSITIYSSVLHDLYTSIKKSNKFIPLSPEFDCFECDLRHFKTTSKINCFIQHESKANTAQLKEDWIGIQSTSSLLIKHTTINNVNFKIPLSKVRRGLRTTSNIRNINVNSILDYLIVKDFKNIKENYLRYITDKKTVSTFKTEEFNKILTKFESRKSFLHLNRRLYLASPGTSYVAFHSKTPFIGVDTWGFNTMNYDEAKLMALWLNSTFGIIQLLMVGVAIEGNWMKVHKYMLENLYIPKPSIFLKNHLEELNTLFETVSTTVVLSLTEQLQIVSDTRKEIDRFFIEKLELNIWKQHGTMNKFLKLLQKELLQELKGLCPSDF